MFHDMGLTDQHNSADERFEVDGANAARDFLHSHGIAQNDIETVWTAIALHTTPGIPQHMRLFPWPPEQGIVLPLSRAIDPSEQGNS
jgi:hypothetical protein